MAAAAMTLAQRLSTPVSLTGGFGTHGIAPAWLTNLLAGIAALRLLIEYTAEQTNQHFFTLHLFVKEFQDYVTQFVGAAGDEEHLLWLRTFSVPVNVQWNAPPEGERVLNELYQCLMALRGWVEHEPDGVLASIQRRVHSALQLLDLGTDYPSAGILKDMLEELEHANSFMCVLIQDRRAAQAALNGNQAGEDAEPDEDDQVLDDVDDVQDDH